MHRLSTSLRDVSYQKLRAVSGQGMPEEMQPLIEALNAMIASSTPPRRRIARSSRMPRTSCARR